LSTLLKINEKRALLKMIKTYKKFLKKSSTKKFMMEDTDLKLPVHVTVAYNIGFEA
jgi:predicted transcriptional regulator